MSDWQMVKLYQIAYKEGLELEFEPINHFPDGTKDYYFLETRVLRDLKATEEYTGVLSPKFREKITESKRWGRDIGNASKVEWTYDNFCHVVEKYKPQIMSFCSHPPHSVFRVAEHYHPGILQITKDCIRKIDRSINVEDATINPIYFNYFVARQDVIKEFQEYMLKPAIEILKKDSRVFTNANYPKPVPEWSEYPYWTFAPFIGERLINLYINRKKLNVLQW